MNGMPARMLKIGNSPIELLSEGTSFKGLGGIWIGDVKVRSGRLPIRPLAHSFTGCEIAGLELLGVEESEKEIRIRLEAVFRPMAVKMMRDHSFDPIHELGDWDVAAVAGTGRIDLVL